jgi:8-oxo-dGTP diphosphatase
VIQVAHALLLVDGAYVMQHRDDKPDIAWPGAWSLFGGTLCDGETPEAGLRREIGEELELSLGACRLIESVEHHSSFWRSVVRLWFFESDVTDRWAGHVVHEGQGARIFHFPEIPERRVPPHIYAAIRRHHEGTYRRVPA